MANERFSKAMVARYLAEKIVAIEQKYKIDPDDGSNQCKGKDADFNQAYGAYRALDDALTALELQWPKEIP